MSLAAKSIFSAVLSLNHTMSQMLHIFCLSPHLMQSILTYLVAIWTAVDFWSRCMDDMNDMDLSLQGP